MSTQLVGGSIRSTHPQDFHVLASCCNFHPEGLNNARFREITFGYFRSKIVDENDTSLRDGKYQVAKHVRPLLNHVEETAKLRAVDQKVQVRVWRAVSIPPPHKQLRECNWMDATVEDITNNIGHLKRYLSTPLKTVLQAVRKSLQEESTNVPVPCPHQKRGAFASNLVLVRNKAKRPPFEPDLQDKELPAGRRRKQKEDDKDSVFEQQTYNRLQEFVDPVSFRVRTIGTANSASPFSGLQEFLDCMSVSTGTNESSNPHPYVAPAHPTTKSLCLPANLRLSQDAALKVQRDVFPRDVPDISSKQAGQVITFGQPFHEMKKGDLGLISVTDFSEISICSDLSSILTELCCRSVSSHETENKLLPRSPTRVKDHRVSFDESQNSYYDNELMSAEDCEELWYNLDEYGKFKHNIIRKCKLLIKHDNKRSHNNKRSVMKVLEHSYLCCFEHDRETHKNTLPPELQEYLLGLERLLVRRIGKDRNELRKCLLEIVNELQSYSWPNKQLLAENIARVSQEVTQASRLFARHLGGPQTYLLPRRYWGQRGADCLVPLPTTTQPCSASCRKQPPTCAMTSQNSTS